MVTKTIRERIDAYTKEKYGIDPEILPFSHEEYEIYRHTENGKWFAVFIVKERSAFGLEGDGTAEIICVKIKDPFFADILMQQPGYLRGYPSSKWNWVSMVLDGTVPFEDICRWLDESYLATRTKAGNLKTPLLKRESSK
ncbi:MAG: MmcQ/YjbR family DNA-binding protein [Clostridia bacterium]|nr:MmcQ/YjbR family DNA-binding protein [Clostridia bacterium]